MGVGVVLDPKAVEGAGEVDPGFINSSANTEYMDSPCDARASMRL
jgi:hypothetical protein